MKWTSTLLCLFLASTLFGQVSTNLLSATPDTAYDNILVRKLASDSSASSFLIWVKKEVKLHYHSAHTETLLILEGQGTMVLGDKTLDVSPGVFLTIPPNTFHDLQVTSEEALKALSVQAPEFKGKDRIFAGQLRKPDSRK